jgi:hypothetical protein
VRMCAPAKPDRRDRIDFEETLRYDAEDRLIICNRAYGELIYPALGMPYERGHPQRSGQGLVEDPKRRQEERVYRRIAGFDAWPVGLNLLADAELLAYLLEVMTTTLLKRLKLRKRFISWRRHFGETISHHRRVNPRSGKPQSS